MKGIHIAICCFIVMACLDLASTLLIGTDLIKYLETNPLYNAVGLLGLVVLNAAVAYFFYKWYVHTKKPSLRYTLLFALIAVSLLRISVVYHNFEVSQNPPTIEQAASIPQEVKNQYYFKTVLPLLLVALPTYLAFYLFEKDHTIRRVES